jgi:hypothetical protein
MKYAFIKEGACHLSERNTLILMKAEFIAQRQPCRFDDLF